MPLLSGLSTGVKHGTKLSATAISMVLWAVKIEPLSDSHCTGCGARIEPKRCSTQRTIMSRIISPEMPAGCAPPPDYSPAGANGAEDAPAPLPPPQSNTHAIQHQPAGEGGRAEGGAGRPPPLP